MDSKPTFGILLVLIGIVGVWLLITGKLSALLGFATGGGTTTTTPTPNGGAVKNGTFLPSLDPSKATTGGMTLGQAQDAIKNYTPAQVTIPQPNFTLPQLSFPTIGITNLAPVN